MGYNPIDVIGYVGVDSWKSLKNVKTVVMFDTFKMLTSLMF